MGLLPIEQMIFRLPAQRLRVRRKGGGRALGVVGGEGGKRTICVSEKPFSRAVLLERIKTVLRRQRSVPNASGDTKALEHGYLRMDAERHTCTWKNKPISLTVTEFLILQALAKRPGVFKNRDALMDAAYDDEVYVDDRTIDSHIKRLRKKFRQPDKSCDLIETIYGVGYRLKE